MTLGARIMLVEDEGIVALNLQQRLSRLGYDVPAIAASCDEALEHARRVAPDLVLMDIRIKGDADGIETAARLNAERSTPIIYLTAYSEDSTLERARATQPYGYLLKPFSEREMHATIQMALQRRVSEKALALSEERLRLAMEAAGMGVLDMDADKRLVRLQGQAARLFGFGGEVDNLPWGELLGHIDGADRERVELALEDEFRTIGRAAVEFHVTGAEDDAGWARLLARRLAPNGHGGDRVIGVVQDVSEARRAWRRIEELNHDLEQKVEARTRDLRESMADLDAFNYSVAHDLRAPVRAVISFTTMILEDYGAALAPDARAGLERVTRAGHRMGELIDALLSLARITRAPLVRQTVSLSAIATEIIGSLRDESSARVVEVDIQPGVVASADPQLMRIVLDNLLRNAWKFTSRHATANIAFGAREVDGVTQYYVRDDGAGFAAGGAANLFGVFQRLHSAAEFDGVGIGLVTVQRIVQRHGGRIRAEGVMEKGALFTFTLG